MNKKTFRKDFATFVLVFEKLNFPNIPDTKDKMTRDIWEAALSSITREQLASSVPNLVKTCKFFPTPAEIVAAVPNKELTGSQAWEKVQEQMDRCCGSPGVLPIFTSLAIINTVKSLGGLNAIWEQTDHYFLIRKKFIAEYEKKVSENRLLPGSDKKKLGGKNEEN